LVVLAVAERLAQKELLLAVMVQTLLLLVLRQLAAVAAVALGVMARRMAAPAVAQQPDRVQVFPEQGQRVVIMVVQANQPMRLAAVAALVGLALTQQIKVMQVLAGLLLLHQ
jgi:hypothetical protein